MKSERYVEKILRANKKDKSQLIDLEELVTLLVVSKDFETYQRKVINTLRVRA